MNEAQEVRRAQQGDDAAWTLLVRQHQAAVFRLAYLLVGDVDDAEDVAQTVFIHAFHGLSNFDSNRPLRPWLLRITRNQAHNWRRRARRYLAALRRFVVVQDEEVTDVFDAEQIEAELLWQAVRQLTRADQEIIYLRYFLELPVADTAETLGIAPGTVKSRLARALGRLREVAEQEFPMLREERVA